MTDMTDARVRPLVWDRALGAQTAQTPWGRYALGQRGDIWIWAWNGSDHPAKSEEAAKTAAQADYTARILSALEPPAAPVPCPYPAAYARGECCGGYCAMDDDAPAAPVPVREWKHGRARALVMQDDDDCFLWIVSDTPEDAAYLTREQFASLLAAGRDLLAAMQADGKVTPETCAHIERDMRGVCFRCADDKGSEE